MVKEKGKYKNVALKVNQFIIEDTYETNLMFQTRILC